jgi:hypothetical protein
MAAWSICGAEFEFLSFLICRSNSAIRGAPHRSSDFRLYLMRQVGKLAQHTTNRFGWGGRGK